MDWAELVKYLMFGVVGWTGHTVYKSSILLGRLEERLNGHEELDDERHRAIEARLQ